MNFSEAYEIAKFVGCRTLVSGEVYLDVYGISALGRTEGWDEVNCSYWSPDGQPNGWAMLVKAPRIKLQNLRKSTYLRNVYFMIRYSPHRSRKYSIDVFCGDTAHPHRWTNGEMCLGEAKLFHDTAEEDFGFAIIRIMKAVATITDGSQVSTPPRLAYVCRRCRYLNPRYRHYFDVVMTEKGYLCRSCARQLYPNSPEIWSKK